MGGNEEGCHRKDRRKIMTDILIKEGIINLHKPAGWTSHDCVNLIRSLSGVKRVGHTGTLDPMAEGVLPICIGSATGVMEYLDMDLKTYVCRMILGISTDTLDIWGEKISDKRDILPNLLKEGKQEGAYFEKIISGFEGKILQIPPKYSALKLRGRKLYEYARAGEEVEIAARPAYIDSIRILDVDPSSYEVEMEIVCAKGTYIRSICRDIGEKLGCGASMSKLTRIGSGYFSLDTAVTTEELAKLKQGENQVDPSTGKILKYARALPEDLNRYINDTDLILERLGEVELPEGEASKFCNGRSVDEARVNFLKKPVYSVENAPMKIGEKLAVAYRAYGIVGSARRFLGVALYDCKHSVYKPDKIFFRK